MAMWRIPQVIEFTGRNRTGLYGDIKAGLMVPVVKIGPRASALPEDEVRAVVAARAAGHSDDQIRELVTKLHAARGQRLAQLTGGH